MTKIEHDKFVESNMRKSTGTRGDIWQSAMNNVISFTEARTRIDALASETARQNRESYRLWERTDGKTQKPRAGGLF